MEDAEQAQATDLLATLRSAALPDDFWMYSYKVLPCPHGYRHSWTHCPFSHAGETARRRCPRQFNYLPDPCPHARAKRQCPNGDVCPYAHNTFEQWLHPSRYRTRLCYLGANCKRATCFFAHSVEELRSNEENEGAAPHPGPSPMPNLPLPPPLPAPGGLPYAVPAPEPLSPARPVSGGAAASAPAAAGNGGAHAGGLHQQQHPHHPHPMAMMCMPPPQMQRPDGRPRGGPPPPGAGLLPGGMHHPMPPSPMLGQQQQQQQQPHHMQPMGGGLYAPRGMGPGAPQMLPHPAMGMGMGMGPPPPPPSGSSYMSPGASPYMSSSMYGAPFYHHPGDFQQPPGALGGAGRTRSWSTPGEAFLTAAGAGPGATAGNGPGSGGLPHHNPAPRASDTGHYHMHHIHAPRGAFGSVPSPPYAGGRGAGGGPVPRHMPAPTNRGPRRISTPSSAPAAGAGMGAGARIPSSRSMAAGVMVGPGSSPAREHMAPPLPPPPARPQPNDAVEVALRQLAFAASPPAGPPRAGRSPTHIDGLAPPPTHIDAAAPTDAAKRGDGAFVELLSAAGLAASSRGDSAAAAAMPYHALLQHVLSAAGGGAAAAAASEPHVDVAPSVSGGGSGAGSGGGSNEHYDDAEEEDCGGERSSDPTPLSLRAALHHMSEMGLAAASTSRNSDPGQTTAAAASAAAGDPAAAAMLLPLLQTLLNEGLATGQFELVNGQLQMRGDSGGSPVLSRGLAAAPPVAVEQSGSPVHSA